MAKIDEPSEPNVINYTLG